MVNLTLTQKKQIVSKQRGGSVVTGEAINPSGTTDISMYFPLNLRPGSNLLMFLPRHEEATYPNPGVINIYG